jgi:ubiquinone/menaquinone biosynthesis C-methylase UbiE
MNKLLTYDELPLWSAPFGMVLLDTVIMKTGMNVLDIGSGSGFPMLELASRLGSTCTIYGLDPTTESIDMITAKKTANGIVNARIIKGVAEDIPFPDAYFNLIVSNNGLNNVADLEKALTECYRVSDRNAQLVFTVNLPHSFIEFYDVFEEVLLTAGMKEEVEKMHAHIFEKRKPADHLTTLVTNAGFTIKTIDPDGFRIRFNDSRSLFDHTLISQHFLPSWKAILPAEQTEPIFRQVQMKLDVIAQMQGELVMSIPFVCYNCKKT